MKPAPPRLRRSAPPHPATCLLALLLVAGCGKNALTPSADMLNENRPNANGRILTQQRIGSPKLVSSFWGLAVCADLSHRFIGQIEGKQATGGLGPSGEMSWHVEPVGWLHDIAVMSAASPLPGGAIVVGGEDTDNDGYAEAGNATLYAPDGSVVNRLEYGSEISTASLSAIAPLSDSEFVATGWFRGSADTHPVLVRLAVGAADTLEQREFVILSQFPKQYAEDVACDPADAGSSARRIFLATRAQGGADVITLQAVDAGAPALGPCPTAWTQVLAGEGVATWEHDLRVFGGDLYVAGETKNPGKTPRPRDGNSWSAALAARLSRDGTLTWAKVMSMTTEDDAFYAIEPSATMVYAIGTAGQFVSTSGSQTFRFGYGWIAPLSPADGTRITNLTFGDVSWSSGFYSGGLTGSVLHVAGSTEEGVDGGTRAWWCAIDASIAAPAASTQPWVPAPPGSMPVRRAERKLGPGPW
jgi:hypothetical protein